MRARTYFVQVVDQETGEPLFLGEIEDCPEIGQAIERASEIGRSRNRGRPVRVTHANEIPEPAESWFLGQLAEAAA